MSDALQLVARTAQNNACLATMLLVNRSANYIEILLLTCAP